MCDRSASPNRILADRHRPSWTWAAALLVGCVSWMEVAEALDPDTALSQYRRTSWGIEDGLPSGTVNALAQTPDGFLWVGTLSGLARFDGVRFTVFDRASRPEFRSNEIRDLCVAGDGTLWIGTADGALRFDGTSFDHIRVDGLAFRQNFFAIECQGDGSALAGPGNGSVVRLTGSGAVVVSNWDYGVKGAAATGIASAPDGRVWLGTYQAGAFACSTDGCRRFAPAAIPSDGKVSALHRDPTGYLWVVLYKGPTFRFDVRGPIEGPAEAIESLPPGVVFRLARDSAGNHWFANRESGLVRLVGRRPASMARFDDGLPPHPFSVVEDSFGSIWFGSDGGGGLHRLSDVDALVYAAEEGWSASAVETVMEDSEGALIVGTMGEGLIRIDVDGEGPTRVGPQQPELARHLTAMSARRDGSLWLATRDGIFVVGADGVARRDPNPGSPKGYTHAMHADARGALWIGGDDGIMRLDPRSGWRRLEAKDGFHWLSATTFAESRDGTLWIGSTFGLIRFRDGRFQLLERGPSQGGQVTSILVDDSGEVWVASRESGIGRVVGDAVIALSPAANLPEDVFSMLDGGDDHLWLCAAAGLFRVPKDDLRNLAQGRPGRPATRRLRFAHGSRIGECSRDEQPLAWRSRSGLLWFATSIGVARVDPSSISAVSWAPHALIESVIVDGTVIDISRPAVLAAGTNRLDVRFTAPNLSTADRTRFRYRVLGVDARWVALSGARQIELAKLSPGGYRIEIQAAEEGQAWTSAPAAFEFRILTPFTRSTPFYLLLAVGVLVLAYGFVRIRTHDARREAAFLRERNDLARELHDTLAQSFSGMLLRLGAASHMAGSDTALTERLDAIQEQARGALAEIRRVVAHMRPTSHAALDLHEILRKQCQEQLRDTGIALRFATSGAPPAVSPYAMNHVCRIVEEAISNALLHSNATDVAVDVSSHEGGAKISVVESGGGRAVEVTLHGGGAGLRGMRERANEIGASLAIRTIPESGTRVELCVPRASLTRSRRLI